MIDWLVFNANLINISAISCDPIVNNYNSKVLTHFPLSFFESFREIKCWSSKQFFVLKACNWSFLTSFEHLYFPYIKSLSKHWLYCIQNSEFFLPLHTSSYLKLLSIYYKVENSLPGVYLLKQGYTFLS